MLMRRLLLATALLCASSMLAYAYVVLGPDPRVSPTADPKPVPNTIDDTERTQAAFAGPEADATVVLKAGHYYPHPPVLGDLTRSLSIPNDNSEPPDLPNLTFPRELPVVVEHNGLDLIDTTDGIVPEEGNDDWQMRANMSVPRQNHAVVALPDGRALIIGGVGMNGVVDIQDNSEIYDSCTNRYTSFPSAPYKGASQHAILLKNGRVLLAAGIVENAETASGFGFTDRSWTVNPLSNNPIWVETGSMPFPQGSGPTPDDQNAVMLPDGKVLVIGEIGGFLFTDDNAYYANNQSMLYTPNSSDPSKGTWDLTRNQTAPVVAQRNSLIGISLTRQDYGPIGAVDFVPKITKLVATSAANFTSADEGQPIVITGASAGNNSTSTKPFYVYKVLSSTECMIWNKTSVNFEGAFTFSVGGRKPWTKIVTGVIWAHNALTHGKVIRGGGRKVESITGVVANAEYDKAAIYDIATQVWTESPPMPAIIGKVSLTMTGPPAGSAISYDTPNKRTILIVPGANFTLLMQSKYIVIENSASNNGTFRISAFIDAKTIAFNNTAGSNEAFVGGTEKFSIYDGEDSPVAMSGPRSSALTALLPDGQVLIANGAYEESNTKDVDRRSALIYDPATPSDPWSITGSTQKRHAVYAQAARLNDGSIMIFGGWDNSPVSEFVPGDAELVDYFGFVGSEIYNPATGTFSPGPYLPHKLVDYGPNDLGIPEGTFDVPPTDSAWGRTTVLSNGRVLYTGGDNLWDQSFLSTVGWNFLYTPGTTPQKDRRCHRACTAHDMCRQKEGDSL